MPPTALCRTSLSASDHQSSPSRIAIEGRGGSGNRKALAALAGLRRPARRSPGCAGSQRSMSFALRPCQRQSLSIRNDDLFDGSRARLIQQPSGRQLADIRPLVVAGEDRSHAALARLTPPRRSSTSLIDGSTS